MTKKNNLKILDHIDLWLKLILKHFDIHRNQGKIFFFNVTIAVCLWSIIIGFYMGEALKEILINLYICK